MFRKETWVFLLTISLGILLFARMSWATPLSPELRQALIEKELNCIADSMQNGQGMSWESVCYAWEKEDQDFLAKNRRAEVTVGEEGEIMVEDLPEKNAPSREEDLDLEEESYPREDQVSDEERYFDEEDWLYEEELSEEEGEVREDPEDWEVEPLDEEGWEGDEPSEEELDEEEAYWEDLYEDKWLKEEPPLEKTLASQRTRLF